MKFLVYLMTMLFVGSAIAQNPTILQGSYISNVFGNSNFVLNPNAQTNIANVTTVTATVTRSTSTPLVATSEFTVAIGTANGTATWATRAFDAGMKNNNCEARFSYRGFAATSKVHIKQGANTVASLTLTPATDPRIASINFPCGDLSTATTFQVTDTAILAGTNEIGGIYVGLATNMANVAQAETVVIANVNAQITVPTATYTNVPYQSESLDAYGEYNNSTGVFTAKRAGNYFIAASMFWLNSTWGATNIYLNVYKNGSLIVENLRQIPAGTTYHLQESSVSISLAVGDTLYVSAYQGDTANRFIAGNSSFSRLSISRFPSSSELVVTPERQNTFGYISGNNADFTTKSATFVTPSGFSLDPATGKCESDGTNLACKIATLPPGRYSVQVSAPMFSQGSNGGNQSCAFGISDGIATDVALGQTLASSNASALYDGISSISRQFLYSSVRTNVIFKLIVKELSSGGAAANCGVFTAIGTKYWQMSVTPLDQPSNSALYVQGPVLGAQTGAAIPAGYQGNYSIFSQTGTLGSTTAGVRTTVTGSSFTLQPGVWRITVIGNLFIEGCSGNSGIGQMARPIAVLRRGSTEIAKQLSGACAASASPQNGPVSLVYIEATTSAQSYDVQFYWEQRGGGGTITALRWNEFGEAAASYIILERIN